MAGKRPVRNFVPLIQGGGFFRRRISALLCRGSNLKADAHVFSITGIAQIRRNTMRDFNFKDDANPSAADFTEIRPQETTPEILRLDDRLEETPREDTSSLR